MNCGLNIEVCEIDGMNQRFWSVSLIFTLWPALAVADEVTFRSIRELWAKKELTLKPSRITFTDADGTAWVIKSGSRCAVFDQTNAKALGLLGSTGDWSCESLGGSPVGEFWFLARGPPDSFCTWRFDDVRRALEEKRKPACATTRVPTDDNPPGGAPSIVGWFDDIHVVLKTAYCCGSYKYHLMNVTTGKSAPLGLSFESGSPRYPTFRPWSAARADYWLVQRAGKAGKELSLGLVHCSKVVEYAFGGTGALQEAKGRKETTFQLPDAATPCEP